MLEFNIFSFLTFQTSYQIVCIAHINCILLCILLLTQRFQLISELGQLVETLPQESSLNLMIQLFTALCLSIIHPVSGKAYCSSCESNFDYPVRTVIPSEPVGPLLRKGAWWTSGERIPMGLWSCCGAICRFRR
jgi:hypothetical protein